MAACAGAALLALAACGGAVTPESYDQIHAGMTLEEVERILGPGEDQSVSGVGISSAGMAGRSREDRTRTYLWKDGPRQIIVEIEQGKVVNKRSLNLD
jgi:hypothetical protein